MPRHKSQLSIARMADQSDGRMLSLRQMGLLTRAVIKLVGVTMRAGLLAVTSDGKVDYAERRMAATELAKWLGVAPTGASSSRAGVLIIEAAAWTREAVTITAPAGRAVVALPASSPDPR